MGAKRSRRRVGKGVVVKKKKQVLVDKGKRSRPTMGNMAGEQA